MTAELALGPSGGLLFAELDSCYIACELYRGADAGVTMEDLEALAERIDYAALDGIDPAVVAANVIPVYESMVVAAEESGSSLTAAQFLAEIGNYRLVLDEDAYCIESMELTFDESLPYDNVTMGYHLRGVTGGDEDITFGYTRFWTNTERTVLDNQAQFQAQKQGFFEENTQEFHAYGFEPYEVTDCTVNGYEAYLVENWWGRDIISWYDTDRELVFDLHVPASFTLEEIMALAESVTGAG